MKKKLMLSILTVIMCLSLSVGATFALFTSQDEVDMTIKSGKVNVTTNFIEGSIATKQLYDADFIPGTGNMFQGEVAVTNENNVKLLTLSNLVPGDAVKFQIKVVNNSNVAIKYRTTVTCDNNEGLFEGLNVSIEGVSANYNGQKFSTGWILMPTGEQDIDVIVELPNLDDETNNKYQGKSCSIKYLVEAVQGNADTSIKYDSNTMGNLFDALNNLQSGDEFVLPEGTYNTTGTFNVPAGVTIKGEEGKEVVIRQNSAAQDDIFFCKGDVVIENITFESNRKGYAITSDKDHTIVGDITVINCKFKGLATEKNYGIYKNPKGDLKVINCTFDNYNNALCGIKNEDGSVTEIIGCTFTNINGEAIGYINGFVPLDFEATVIANNTGLTAENVIDYTL